MHGLAGMLQEVRSAAAGDVAAAEASQEVTAQCPPDPAMVIVHATHRVYTWGTVTWSCSSASNARLSSRSWASMAATEDPRGSRVGKAVGSVGSARTGADCMELP